MKSQEISSRIQGFIRSIHEGLSHGPEDTHPNLVLSKENEGSVLLSDPETTEFKGLATQLLLHFGKKEEISRQTIEGYLQQAIFSALDIRSLNALPFERRLDGAVTQVIKRLAESPAEHTCYVPVGGIANEGLPFRLGPLRFVVLNEYQLRRLAKSNKPLAAEAMEIRRHILSDLKEIDIWHKAVAEVSARAKDFEAASTLAVGQTRRTLRVINFFADLVPYSHGWVYLPPEAMPIRSGLPIRRNDGALYISHSR